MLSQPIRSPLMRRRDWAADGSGAARADGNRHPATDGTAFNFFGFTHVWGTSRNGKNVMRQVTAKDQYARALASVSEWCRDNRGLSVAAQHAHLSKMVRGHFAYYAIIGNARRIRWYLHQVERIWKKWLSRKGGRNFLWTPPTRVPRPAQGHDHSQIRRRERTSCVKNRMREFRTSGSVRGGDGDIPTYSAEGKRDGLARRGSNLLVGGITVALHDAAIALEQLQRRPTTLSSRDRCAPCARAEPSRPP